MSTGCVLSAEASPNVIFRIIIKRRAFCFVCWLLGCWAAVWLLLAGLLAGLLAAGALVAVSSASLVCLYKLHLCSEGWVLSVCLAEL